MTLGYGKRINQILAILASIQTEILKMSATVSTIDTDI